MIPSPEKKILDVTCGSRTIWFDKHHPAALYCDNRQEYETRIWKEPRRDSRARLYRKPTPSKRGRQFLACEKIWEVGPELAGHALRWLRGVYACSED